MAVVAGLVLAIHAPELRALSFGQGFGRRLLTLSGPGSASRLIAFDHADVWSISTASFGGSHRIDDDVGGGERFHPFAAVADRDGDGWQDYAAIVGRELAADRARVARAIVSSGSHRVLWRSPMAIRERSGPYLQYFVADDIDGDGWPEWLAQTWRNYEEEGELALRRSSDDSLVALRGLSPDESPIVGEDCDGDGVRDITLAAYGRVFLVSGRNLATLDSTDARVALGQGEEERQSLLAGACGSRVVRLGAELHWIQVLRCGKQLVVRDVTPMKQTRCWQTWIDTFDDGGYDTSIAVGGDVDRDGCPDVLVARPAFMFSDCVYTLSGRGGQLLRTDRVPEGEHSAWHFGTDLAIVGDVDRDGIEDYAASDVEQGSRRSGRVFIVSGADGEFLDSFGVARLWARRFGWR